VLINNASVYSHTGAP
jgi:NAD(P)-dependent dehydrogenase (short-subunit alcohol dehydrogenase family)